MSQKNETTVLAVSLLTTLAIMGGGGWFYTQYIRREIDPPTPTPPKILTIEDRISFGEKTLITGEITPEKQAGINAIASRNYSQAINNLESSLRRKPNDPEALIYLNNARIGSAPSYTIVVSAPIITNPKPDEPNPGLEILRGVAQAQNEINAAEKIEGVFLKIGIANDDNNPDVAQEVANNLVKNSQVLGVVGHFGSDTTIAAGSIYNNGKLVAISPTSTSVEISKSGPYVFRTVPSDLIAGRALADYMVNSLKKTKAVVFFNSQSSYSKSLKDNFFNPLISQGGEVIEEFDISENNFNAAQSVQRANEQGAEVLMLAANTPTLSQALQVIKINDRRRILLGGDSFYSKRILEEGNAQSEGMVVAAPWHIDGDPLSSFPRRSRELWRGDVSWRTALSYDATVALIAALKRNPTRSGVQEALSNRNFSANGASGVIRFFPSGDRNTSVQLVKIVPASPSRSGTGFDFEPVK
ncbi:ABC transporter substrate-binding protein [Nostoc sp. UHCC 0870]|uniref:ABC transporter substrate-binding protein n=1 Tax=Nostoc sp. UHCC 0870 TaxID=2914041 RepID=UPI001EDE81AC|nr:ABC transporter substrate-binding protein [Nostoc sp. UHCC 0870]UKO99213.1 ABC transporter substrate-binding protein [Nostoc sp. UHCC 0870]